MVTRREFLRDCQIARTHFPMMHGRSDLKATVTSIEQSSAHDKIGVTLRGVDASQVKPGDLLVGEIRSPWQAVYDSGINDNKWITKEEWDAKVKPLMNDIPQRATPSSPAKINAEVRQFVSLLQEGCYQCICRKCLTIFVSRNKYAAWCSECTNLDPR